MFAPIYLDYNATTPMNTQVLAAMQPYLSAQFGNPSSRHEFGRAARAAVDQARSQVAAAVGAHPTEVVFTSGGTEANNLFIKGTAERFKPGRLRVGATEHPSVLAPARQLARRGWALDYLAVDADGVTDLHTVRASTQTPADLVSLMMANNETGVIQPVEAVADMVLRAARDGGGVAWFHTDAVQAFGKIEINFREINRAGVHAMSVSAHKIGGPKGVGALIVDKRVELQPLLAGGGHERGLRSGTENVAAIVGFGAACERLMASDGNALWSASQDSSSPSARHGVPTRLPQLAKFSALRRLQEMLEARLLALGATVFARAATRLPNTTFFALAAIDGETLVGKLDRAGYAVASGSACSSAQPEASHVLAAMGVSDELSRGAVRVSFGPDATEATVDGFLNALQQCVQGLRGTASMAVAA